MIKLKVKGGYPKYLIALLDVLHKHYSVRCEYDKSTFSTTLNLRIEGVDEEMFVREIQSFCSQVGVKTEVER
ncbi:MAG: hypothetical protein QXH91_06870 [Candidatus Bathyarchaeia archaeon]